MNGRLLLTASFFCSSLVSSAQLTFRGPEDVWDYAEKHNLEINMSGKQQELATAGVRQALGNFLPSATFNASFTDNVLIQPTLVPAELFGGTPGTYIEEKFGKRYNYGAGLNAHIDLINASNWYGVRVAHQQALAGELNGKLTRQEVYRATAQAFFQCRWAIESERLAGEASETATQIARHAQYQFHRGLTNEMTFNNSLIAQKNAAVAQLGAKQNRINAISHLKNMLGLATADSIIIYVDSLTNLEFDGSEPLPASQLSVRYSQTQMLRAKNSWQAARSAYLPTLAAVYSYQTQLTGSTLFGFDDSNRLPQQYWGLRLSIPLLTNQSRVYQNQKTRLEWEMAGQQYASSLKKASLADENLVSQFSSALRVLRGSQEILELYRKNDQHAMRLMNAGQVSLDERLRVYGDYLNYRNEYLKNLLSFYTLYSEMMVRQRPF